MVFILLCLVLEVGVCRYVHVNSISALLTLLSMAQISLLQYENRTLMQQK